MLEVQLNKRLGTLQVEVEFMIAQSGITVLFGPSGAGKTSIINMLAGLLSPDSGRIRVGGRLLFDSRCGINLPPERRKCGYVFQDKRLFPFLSVRSNLLFAAPRESRSQLPAVVELLGIGHLLERRTHDLSGGEAQRVAIGRALLSAPEYLLMDEPMSSLDDDRKAELMPYIGKLAEVSGIPIVLVTHSRDELRRLADRIVYLEKGRVQAFPETAASGSHQQNSCPYCRASLERERPVRQVVSN